MNIKYSVGDRVNHNKYGEGMVVQLKGNQVEVVFIDDQKHLFPIDSNELKSNETILSNGNNSLDVQLPSTAKKIQKELDQLKEENRVEYFDYEIASQKANQNTNKNSKVIHEKFGEGMITKIFKNEYQIIFLDGVKRTIPINSTELKFIKQIEEDLLKSEKIRTANANSENNEIVLGKQYNHPDYGEGMVCNITDSFYEIIFLDGNKKIFSFKNSSNTPEYINTNIINKKTEEDINDSYFSNNILAIGKQMIHPVYGEGMVSKIYDNEYEIILLNGEKKTIPIESKKPENNLNENTVSVKQEKNKKPTEYKNFDPEINIEIKIGNQFLHEEYGEGMISKVNESEFEVIFLDGRKIKFPLHKSNIEEKNKISKGNENIQNIKMNVENKISENPIIELPIEKFSKKSVQSSEIRKPEIYKTTDSNTKTIQSELDKSINLFFNKFQSEGIQTGCVVKHPKNGYGVVCNIDEFEIEVVFFNHKKIVFSAQSNVLTFINIQ